MHFILKAFDPSASVMSSIQATIERASWGLWCQYELKGPLSELVYSLTPQIERKDEVWKGTCVELFLANEQDEYLEGNLNFAGQWNVYHYQSYRGTRANSGCEWELQEVKENKNQLVVTAHIKWDRPFDFKKIAATAVVSRRDGITEYWALNHVSEKPDFHRLESFVNWTEA